MYKIYKHKDYKEGNSRLIRINHLTKEAGVNRDGDGWEFMPYLFTLTSRINNGLYIPLRRKIG